MWTEFASLSAIPRRSKHEHQAVAYALAQLAAFGVTSRLDHAGNIVADIPASADATSAEPVILQAHLDMVCEADGTVATHPAADGVFPELLDGWVHAPGTTLGADDGIGVAVALAIAAQAMDGRPADAPHPPIQLLLTVDEEVDFTGAAAVDRDLIAGRTLINLDSEHEDELIVGSAGGSRVSLRIPAGWEPAPETGQVVELRILGLVGGHSGHEIDDNVMNALKALGYLLSIATDRSMADESAGIRVADLSGGTADNAIPRDARAVLVVEPEARAVLERTATEVERRMRSWRADRDEEARVEIIDWHGPRPRRVFSSRAARAAMDTLVALPSGVLAIDETRPDLVRTSTNLGIVSTDDDDIVLVSHPRSSREGDLDMLHVRYASFARLAGGTAIVTSPYPAWRPEFDSPLVRVVRAAHVEVYGREPIITVVHAGLEAGELAARLPGLRAVSIGPTVHGAHAPGERLDIGSVGRLYEVVRRVLARLAVADPT